MSPHSELPDSVTNWKSALADNSGSFNGEELVWYDAESPRYSGDPTPEQTEAARRFVSNWLNTDAYGFVIPGDEWGKSLYHWLNILVAREAEGSQEAEQESQSVPNSKLNSKDN